MSIEGELCPRGTVRINRKKNRDQRRVRHAYPEASEFEETTVGEGDDARMVLKAVRWDGAKVTRELAVKPTPTSHTRKDESKIVRGVEIKNPPSRHIRIPRRPVGMIRDPWSGRGKHKRNVLKGQDAAYQQRDSIRRRNMLAVSGSESGRKEKRRRAESGKGKNTFPKPSKRES